MTLVLAATAILTTAALARVLVAPTAPGPDQVVTPLTMPRYGGHRRG